MNICEPKNIWLSKQSFRKTKASMVSGHSDDETHQETLQIKRLQGTMDVCMEDPKGENFSEQLSQMDERDSLDKRFTAEKMKEVKRSMLQ